LRETHADAIVLLVHDGELADVAALLSEIGLETRECLGKSALEDGEKPWDLVIGTPPRLGDLGSHAQGTRIAVVDKDSKTLRTMLNRVGVDYTVRRPFHPTALRLLMIHAVYRGPERRRTRRVHVGAKTRFRTGMRRHAGVLADLSITGCRLLAPMSLSRSRRVRVQVPADSQSVRTFWLAGQVVRSGPAPEEPEGTQMIAVRFEKPSRRELGRLRAAIRHFGTGTATLVGMQVPAIAVDCPRAADADARSDAPEPIASMPDSNGNGHDRCQVPNPTRIDPTPSEDLRDGPRRSLDRRIIALGEEATRVLMGRDISLGGMRVGATPGLSVGDCVQIALHVRPGVSPLVVHAEVTRDEAEDGLVLAFRDLNDSSRSYLETMVEFLPILAVGDEDENESEGVVVSEILEHMDR
jgi:hypothetical protein